MKTIVLDKSLVIFVVWRVANQTQCHHNKSLLTNGGCYSYHNYYHEMS